MGVRYGCVLGQPPGIVRRLLGLSAVLLLAIILLPTGTSHPADAGEITQIPRLNPLGINMPANFSQGVELLNADGSSNHTAGTLVSVSTRNFGDADAELSLFVGRNETARWIVEPNEEAEIFRQFLPASGIVYLDLQTPGNGTTLAFFMDHDEPCPGDCDGKVPGYRVTGGETVFRLQPEPGEVETRFPTIRGLPLLDVQLIDTNQSVVARGEVGDDEVVISWVSDGSPVWLLVRHGEHDADEMRSALIANPDLVTLKPTTTVVTPGIGVVALLCLLVVVVAVARRRS